MDLETLLRAVRDGNPEAWEELYARLSSELRRYFLRDFDAATTAELTQRTLVELVGDLPGLKLEKESIRNWVFGVARNQRRLEYRARAKDRVLGDFAPMAGMSPTQRLLDEEIWAMLLEEIERLPDHFRRVIEHDLHDSTMGDDELARQEGVQVATIRTRRHRGTKRLRTRMLARMKSSPLLSPLLSLLPPPPPPPPPPTTTTTTTTSSSSSSSSPPT